MHNRNFGNGISEDQLVELLGSLPKAHAPRSMEAELLQRIHTDHLQVAHLLSTLSPVSAHPEFDERLFQAIREYKRTGAVIPGPFAGGTSFATLLKGFGWLRTGIAAGAAIVLAVGGAAIYDGLQPQPTLSPTVPVSVQPIQEEQPMRTPSQDGGTQKAETPDIIEERHQAAHLDPTVREKVDAMHADEHASASRTAPIFVPETSQTAPKATAKSAAAEAQRGDMNNDTGNEAVTTTETEEHKDSVAIQQQNREAPASTVHTGDSVNTGGDIETGSEEDTPSDSLRSRH